MCFSQTLKGPNHKNLYDDKWLEVKWTCEKGPDFLLNLVNKKKIIIEKSEGYSYLKKGYQKQKCL